MSELGQTEIQVHIAPRFAARLDDRDLRRVVAEALRRAGWTGKGELSLVVTDDDGIRELNRRFRGLDAPTDVLAFGPGQDSDRFVAAPASRPYLGDVIVSYPRAVAQAEEWGHTVTQELNLLIVHGLLHLLGYDHADEGRRAEMWAKQDEILSASHLVSTQPARQQSSGSSQ